jgi:hypothetical protein
LLLLACLTILVFILRALTSQLICLGYYVTCASILYHSLPLVQAVLDKAAAFAASAGDEVYVQRAQQQRTVLIALRSTAEAYLREYLRRIAAASRINAQSRKSWEMTPLVSLTVVLTSV